MGETVNREHFLVCWPGGNDNFEKMAKEICCMYQRESGADEPEHD